MLKKLMIGTALSAFALSGAFAQSNPSPDPPTNSQQQMQSGSGGGSQMKPSTVLPSYSATVPRPSGEGINARNLPTSEIGIS